MKCDLCENEATVREVTVRNGKRIERHLCESCAAKHGIDSGGGAANVAGLIKQFMNPQEEVTVTVATAGPPTQRPGACPVCKHTLGEFKQAGLLGCPECYRVFEPQLGPLIERAHEGAVAHAGKIPKRLVSGKAATPARVGFTMEERAARLRALQLQLEQAVKGEQYEVAAKVRDEIRKLDQPGADPGLGGAA